MRHAFISLALSITIPAVAEGFTAGSWADLTHSFNEDPVYWPTAKMFEIEEVFHGTRPAEGLIQH